MALDSVARKKKRDEAVERSRQNALEAKRAKELAEKNQLLFQRDMSQKTFKVNKTPKKRTYDQIASDFYFVNDFIKKYPKDEVAKFHNQEQQRKNFFKQYIFKYYIPEIIFNEALASGTTRYGNESGNTKIAQEWIWDIISGESFYKLHKDLFTKQESHFILSDRSPYKDRTSFNKLIYTARCKARGLSPKLTSIVSRVFTIKFDSKWKHRTVLDFLNFIERNKDYEWEFDELSDICDFVQSEITNMMALGRDAITFAGRTINSVIELSNSWHNRQRKYVAGGEKWEGLPIANGTYEEQDSVWEVTQILNSKRLSAEGNKMHHCVGSYEYKCVKGYCGIFNISKMDKRYSEINSMATVEVDTNGTIIQARASCNKALTPMTMKILDKWCTDNHLHNSVRNYRF